MPRIGFWTTGDLHTTCAEGAKLSNDTNLEILVEAELYAAAELFVSLRLPNLLAQRAGSGRTEVFAQIVATTASNASGRWTRPDVAAFAISRGDFVPYWRADLHTFEIKTARGLDVTSVHEANAHGRFGHFAWLVFQAVGNARRDTAHFEQVLASAAFVGVGVISFEHAGDPSNWTVEQWPIRTNADNSVADAFINERFDSRRKASIRGYLAELGWKDMRLDNA